MFFSPRKEVIQEERKKCTKTFLSLLNLFFTLCFIVVSLDRHWDCVVNQRIALYVVHSWAPLKWNTEHYIVVDVGKNSLEGWKREQRCVQQQQTVEDGDDDEGRKRKSLKMRKSVSPFHIISFRHSTIFSRAFLVINCKYFDCHWVNMREIARRSLFLFRSPMSSWWRERKFHKNYLNTTALWKRWRKRWRIKRNLSAEQLPEFLCCFCKCSSSL